MDEPTIIFIIMMALHAIMLGIYVYAFIILHKHMKEVEEDKKKYERCDHYGKERND